MQGDRPFVLPIYAFIACMPSLHLAHELVLLYCARSSRPFLVLSALFVAPGELGGDLFDHLVAERRERLIVESAAPDGITHRETGVIDHGRDPGTVDLGREVPSRRGPRASPSPSRP